LQTFSNEQENKSILIQSIKAYTFQSKPQQKLKSLENIKKRTAVNFESANNNTRNMKYFNTGNNYAAKTGGDQASNTNNNMY